MIPEICEDLRTIITPPVRSDADRLMMLAITNDESHGAETAASMRDTVPEGRTIRHFSRDDPRRPRTINAVERCNQAPRRSRVAGVFRNDESCRSLVTAILKEIVEEWPPGPISLPMEHPP